MTTAHSTDHDETATAKRELSHVFVARAVYGLISVLAVLQVMEDHPPAAWRGAVTLFGTTFDVALLAAYADSIAGFFPGNAPSRAPNSARSAAMSGQC